MPENSQDRWCAYSLRGGGHVNYHKNDRWRSYRFYRALQRLKSPTHDICEIFGAPRFSSFSTQSERSGRSTKREVRKVPILLQKSFLGDERNFLGPLMRFVF